MTGFKKALFLLTFTLVGVACGSSNSDSNNGGPNTSGNGNNGSGDDAGISAQDASGDGSSSAETISQDDFVSGYAAAMCNQEDVEPCCEAISATYSRAACLQKNTPASFGATVIFDGHAAALCLAAVRDVLKSSCAKNLSAEQYQKYAEQYQNCGKIFTGTLANGEGCSHPFQCQRPPNGSVSCVGGGCRQERAVGMGEKCGPASPDGYFDTCGADGYCSDANVCTARNALGADCMANDECTTNRCSLDDHKCAQAVPPQGLGGSCTGESDCQAGMTCDHRGPGACGVFNSNFFFQSCIAPF